MAICHNGNGPDWKECAMISAVVNAWATLKHNLVQHIFPYIEMTATLQTMNTRWFSLLKIGENYRYFYRIRMMSHVRHGVSNYLQLYCFSGPCITNVIATCRKNFSQWESSFLWKLRCHWLKFLRRVAKPLVIQGPEACSSLHKKPTKALHHWPFIGWIH